MRQLVHEETTHERDVDLDLVGVHLAGTHDRSPSQTRARSGLPCGGRRYSGEVESGAPSSDVATSFAQR